MTDQEMREYDLRTSESRARDDKRRAIAQGATLAMLRANGVSKAVFTAEGLVSVEFFPPVATEDMAAALRAEGWTAIPGRDAAHGVDAPSPAAVAGNLENALKQAKEKGFFVGITPDDPLLDTAKTK